MQRAKRWTLIGSLLLLLTILVAAFLFPYLLKRVIERNSEDWIGRKVSIGSIVLNPFTGTYAVNGLVCHEPQSDRVFVSFTKLGVKGSVIDGLLNDHWSFRQAELREPYMHIDQKGDRFNFSDLLELAGSQEGQEVPVDTALAAFSIHGIELSGGRIDYISDLLHAPLQVIDIHATSNRITSADARMDFTIGMGMPDGTRLDGGFMIDTDSARYAVDARLRSFDLAGSLPYLQDFFSAGHLAGKLDIDLRVVQSYTNSSQLALSASMDLRKLEVRDPDQQNLLSIGHLKASLDTLVGDHFELGAIELEGLDLRFALLADSTDNWTRLIDYASDSASSGSDPSIDASASNYLVLLADYVSYLGGAVTAGQYTADSIVVRNGRLLFEDHSIPRSLRYDITDIEVRAKRFTTASEKAPVTATATLNGVGRVMARADFDPVDLRNVDLYLLVDSLMMADLDPYTSWYAAHPAMDGIVHFETNTSIRDGQMDSRNQLHIDRLKFGKRHDEVAPGMYVLPLRLAAGLLKDAKGMIDLDVPVKGDLRDPQFRVWPIVWQVLKNLVVKAVTAPAKMIARMFEGADEKDLEQIRFRDLQAVLEPQQRRTLEQLVKALEAKPELSVDLVPVVDSLKESTALALFTAKAWYLFPDAPDYSSADSVRIIQLAANDSSFGQWLAARLPGSEDLSVGARCVRMIGEKEAMRAWGELEYARREHVMQALLGADLEPARLRFRQGTTAEVGHHRGLPGYLFVYDVLP